jgi:deoxycytidine triphosphate deaminase
MSGNNPAVKTDFETAWERLFGLLTIPMPAVNLEPEGETMTALSRPSVLRLLDQNQIAIDPFDPDRLSPDGSYCLTLGKWARQPPSGPAIDTLRPCLPTYSVFDLHGGMEFYPGEFMLLETAERIRLGSRLIGLLSTHPSLAKLGLDLIQSSSLVLPGSDCQLTLETNLAGPSPVILYAGIKAVKMVLFRGD